LDSVETEEIGMKKDVLDKIDNLKLFILNFVGNLYKIFLPTLTIISIFIFLIFTFMTKIRNNPLYLINLFLLFSISTRVVILSIINAISFNSLYVVYFSPLYPLVIIFIMFNLFLLKSVFSNKCNSF
jgi:hypothetical protein